MGTLQYAILGLLNRKDMTGYDLSKEFEANLSEFWSAKHSQIYPELKALTDKKYVEFKTEISGNVLEKKLYKITAAGKDKLLEWEKTFFKMKPVPKDEFKLQLFFSDCLPPDQRILLLQNQLSQHRERLMHLKNNSEKFDSVSKLGEAEFSDYLVLLGAITREEGMCDWLETCIRLCTERCERNDKCS